MLIAVKIARVSRVKVNQILFTPLFTFGDKANIATIFQVRCDIDVFLLMNESYASYTRHQISRIQTRYTLQQFLIEWESKKTIATCLIPAVEQA